MKRTLSLTLALLILLSSCSSPADSSTQETKSDSTLNTVSSQNQTETETDADERTGIADNLPEKSFGGRSFRVLTSDTKEFQFLSEELSGEVTNDAVFERNLRIEDRFDVKIESVLEKYPYDAVDQYVTSGINAAEVVDHYQYKAYVPISKGNYLDWNTIPYISQDQPWWNKASNEGSTINGKLFCITGDLSITSMQYTYAMFFNMDLMDQYGYPSSDLYSTVLEGNWTLDRLSEVASSIYADSNGDGLENEGDVFGYAYWYAHGTDVWVTAVGEHITALDGNTLAITLDTEKVYSTLEKLNNLIYSTTGAHKYPEEAVGRTEFKSGNVGIMNLMFSDCYSHLRDIDYTYGVLPYPKYDTAQSGYYTNSLDQFSVFGAPKTLPAEDYEFLGIMMEVLNAESYKTVYPAFYDSALKGKYSEDRTTAEMIDLIMEGRVFEFSFQFGEYLSDLPYTFRNCLLNNTTDLASTLQKNRKAINKKLKELYSFYADDETTAE